MSTRPPQTAPRPSRRRPDRYEALAEAPHLPWPDLYRYLGERFRQGDHVAVLGPTGSGKTHLALAVADLRDYVIVIACKPKDPLVEDAVAHGYRLLPGHELRDEVEYSEGTPLHRRLVFWPRLPRRAGRKAIPDHSYQLAEKAYLRRRVAGALGYVRAEGHWAVILDEGTYVCRDLGLQEQVDQSLMQFRTLKASLIVLGQRPAWMGRYVLSQPTFVLLFRTANRDDRKALGDVSGADPYLVEAILEGLDSERHEFLMIDTRAHRMFRSIAPPR